MKRLDPVYKSILNEVARDEFIPPWIDDFLKYPHQYPDFTKPIQRPTVKPNNPPFVEHEPNVIAPDGYTEPGQDLQVRPEITDQEIRDIEDYIQNPQNSPKPKPPAGFTLPQWLIYLASLGIITLPWWWFFVRPTGGNPEGYPPGMGPDNWTGDYPPPFPPIYPPNTPMDL